VHSQQHACPGNERDPASLLEAGRAATSEQGCHGTTAAGAAAAVDEDRRCRIWQADGSDTDSMERDTLQHTLSTLVHRLRTPAPQPTPQATSRPCCALKPFMLCASSKSGSTFCKMKAHAAAQVELDTAGHIDGIRVICAGVYQPAERCSPRHAPIATPDLPTDGPPDHRQHTGQCHHTAIACWGEATYFLP
jgi:hypothetical protein